MASIVILGGGFGGLEAANLLRQRLGREHIITVIDRAEPFVMGLAKIDVILGRRSFEQASTSRRLLERKGIRFIQAEASKIDTAAKKVVAGAEELSYDFLIVALGAELAPESVKGSEHGCNIYSHSGALAARDAIASLSSGRLMLLVSSLPFKCPAAPYEAAMLLKDFFRQKGSSVEVSVFTPEPHPLPVAGKAVGGKVADLLQQRKIRYVPNMKVSEIRQGEVAFESGDVEPFDVMLLVPPHKVPSVVPASGLAASWIPVDPFTLKTNVEGVYAIGDAAAVKLPNGAMLPKTGVFAEGEAEVAAAGILSEMGIPLQGLASRYSGQGGCYVEVGGSKATLISGRFFEPQPVVEVEEPSGNFLKLKAEFELSRISKWFL